VGDNQPVRDKPRGSLPKSEKSSVSFEPKNPAELASFFQENKNEFHEIWVVLTKKKYANPQPVSFTQALAEAILQGLVDSRTKTINDQKYAVRITKRKAPKSFPSKG
jgi:hypothetical protein